MNEVHEVVGWQLTQDEKFDTSRDLLTNINVRMTIKGLSIEFFVIDNCSKRKFKLNEVLGDKVKVKLDLFHAIKRISLTINKRQTLL